jgi:NAD(P)H-hydrate epimerase
MQEIKTIPKLPKRPLESHKGDFGRVLVIAGSRGMAGAAALCGASALRSGAGLVTVACPVEIQATVAQFEPSYMTWPLPQDEQGKLSFAASRADLLPLIELADVVALGPGLGRSEGVTELVHWILAHSQCPAIIDADALNALVGHFDVLAERASASILTPHPGEFARLTNVSVGNVNSDRTANAGALAGGFEGRVIVVLKGNASVVTDGRRFHVNSSGNPGMATGGSGDCLTGVLAALVGQKLQPFEAAVLGVYAHGLAGDIARDQNGEVGMIAGDLVDALPDAFFHLGEPE